MAVGLIPTEKWASYLAPSAEAAMNATVTVFVPVQGSYDLATDVWSNSETVVYSGKARVQPIRSSRLTDGTSVQTVRVQIPHGSGAVIRPDMRMRVDSSPLSPSLEQYEIVVTGTLESSILFETTFEGTVNDETVE